MSGAPFRDTTAWARNLAAPLRDFMRTETGGAVVLLCAAIAALVWANSPWPESYESVWTTELAITLGDHGISLGLREWVNEGLMTFFFLVVGLEAKRELDLGALRERRRIAVPLGAALGGMALAVAVFLLFNAGGDGAHGWGAAMSTDTAFALGVLALVAPGGTRLRVRLLTVAVFDDLVALLVIATVYSDDVDLMALAVAAVLFASLLPLRYAPAGWRMPAAALLGVGVWVALHEAGVDPVITGLAVGIITSAYPPARADLEQVTELTRSFREQPTPQLARSAQLGVAAAISPNERIQYRLHPWTSFVIVPLFALANTGIQIDGDLLADAVTSPITLGIFFGYVVGKPLGLLLATTLVSRLWPGGIGLAITFPVRVGGAVVAGIGFTVSLLIANLAFEGEQLEQAKVGVLASGIFAALAALAVFRLVGRLPDDVRERQLSRTAEDLVDLTEEVDPERDHVRGAADAPVTLLEYGDYECPYCGQAEVAIREVLDAFGGDLRYVWRHLPLNDVHPNAQMAAEAAEAAAAQGEFWPMHDLLLAHQDELRPPDLTRYAGQLGLDVDRFWDDLRHRDHLDRVAEDVASADAGGVAGTPTLLHQRAPPPRRLRRRLADAGRRGRAETRAARPALVGCARAPSLALDIRPEHAAGPPERRRRGRLHPALRMTELPAEVLDRLDEFTGRGWVLDAVEGWLADPDGTLLITGPAGTGKSTVAARLAQRRADVDRPRALLPRGRRRDARPAALPRAPGGAARRADPRLLRAAGARCPDRGRRHRDRRGGGRRRTGDRRADPEPARRQRLAAAGVRPPRPPPARGARRRDADRGPGRRARRGADVRRREPRGAAGHGDRAAGPGPLPAHEPARRARAAPDPARAARPRRRRPRAERRRPRLRGRAPRRPAPSPTASPTPRTATSSTPATSSTTCSRTPTRTPSPCLRASKVTTTTTSSASSCGARSAGRTATGRCSGCWPWRAATG